MKKTYFSLVHKKSFSFTFFSFPRKKVLKFTFFWGTKKQLENKTYFASGQVCSQNFFFTRVFESFFAAHTHREFLLLAMTTAECVVNRKKEFKWLISKREKAVKTCFSIGKAGVGKKMSKGQQSPNCPQWGVFFLFRAVGIVGVLMQQIICFIFERKFDQMKSLFPLST